MNTQQQATINDEQQNLNSPSQATPEQSHCVPFPPQNPPSLSLDSVTTVTMPVLQPGNNGEAVRFLQQILISRGYHIIQFNANFDRYTYQGVLEFQRDNGLVADGVVGWHTWRKLGEAIVSNRRRH